jgi:hypothetical protein
VTARRQASATAARRAVAALLVLGALAAGCRSDGQDRAASPAPGTSPTPTTAPTGSSTATAAGGRSAPVRSGFLAFGDFGGGPAQEAVAAAMDAWAASHWVDALVTTGDNVYERASRNGSAPSSNSPTGGCVAPGPCG